MTDTRSRCKAPKAAWGAACGRLAVSAVQRPGRNVVPVCAAHLAVKPADAEIVEVSR